MLNFKVFIALFALISTVYGAYKVNGTCPTTCDDIRVNVTIEKLVGIWYVQGMVPFFFQENAKCSYENITALGSNLLLVERSFYDLEIDESRKTDQNTTITSDGHTLTLLTELKIPISYHIIALTADYFVLYNCYECGLYETEDAGIHAQILTRLQEPPCEVIDAAFDKLVKCGIPLDAILVEDQEDCKVCFEKP